MQCKQLTFGSLVALFSAALISQAVNAQVIAPTGLGSITAAGSGCVGGNVSGAFIDNETIELAMDTMTAVDDGNMRDGRVNCQLSIDLSVLGTQFAVTAVEFTYDAALVADVINGIGAYAYIQGDAQTRYFDGLDINTDATSGAGLLSVSPDNAAWTPCDAPRNLELNFSAKMPRSGAATGNWLSITPHLLKLKARAC